MTKSKIFLYFCLAFIGGIFLSSVISVSQLAVLGFLVLGVFLIAIFWKYKKLVVMGFCLLILMGGVWHHQQAELKISNRELKDIGYYNDLEIPITFRGMIVKEPDIRSSNIKLTIGVEEIKQFENGSRTIKGRVLVTVNRYPEYNYGDELEITGKLLTPKEFEDFNYKDYLAKDGIYSVMYWPEIEVIAEKQGNFVYAKILSFKNKLRESIYSSLSPPQSSILGAIILGDKRKISDEWKQKLNVAGVRHITAVSGLHTIILSGILMWLGMRLGLWRGQAFYFAIILLALFIIMVGLPASAVRAGIMAGIFLFAQKIGRMRSADRAIVFAATLMLIQNPLLLRLDVGFQLSFLAALGIIYLMPVFQYWFSKIPNFRFFPIGSFFSPVRGLLAMTFAAQIFTLPILIYNFGYMSRIAPLANVLVVPLLPYIMVLGFVFGLVGMFWQPLGWVFSFPALFLLTYLTKIVDWFSGFSWASLTIENIHWGWLIVAYLVLGYFTWWLNKKKQYAFLGF
jgi:competence protein ComEC